ncbi:MAG TPA: hypothetical protein PLX06_03435 [Fimbriimonadaceae bacterium]|nr:hypothetical protein [Fimbriimonadaceae bacterium]
MNFAIPFLMVALAAPQTPTTLADVAKASGLTLEVVEKPTTWPARNYQVVADAASAGGLKKYEPLFVEEWNRYPASLFKKAKVTKLIIGAKVAMNGQIRAAVPAFDLDTMFYDAELGNYRPDYQRVVIHHELFHMIDQRMGVMRRDPEWAALNGPEFKYGDGGHNVRNLGAGELTDKLPGLLTPYAGSAVEEDKAELFAHLLVNPAFVTERAKLDPVLAKKIELLKRRLATFDPGLGESFWRPVRSGAAVIWGGKFELQIPQSAPSLSVVLR